MRSERQERLCVRQEEAGDGRQPNAALDGIDCPPQTMGVGREHPFAPAFRWNLQLIKNWVIVSCMTTTTIPFPSPLVGRRSQHR